MKRNTTRRTAIIIKFTFTAVFLSGAFALSAVAADTNQLWDANCAMCHGKDGKGDTMIGHLRQIKDLTDPKVQAAVTDEQITKFIKDGITKNGRTDMKAFGDKLNADQIKALVGKVRSLKSGK